MVARASFVVDLTICGHYVYEEKYMVKSYHVSARLEILLIH